MQIGRKEEEYCLTYCWLTVLDIQMVVLHRDIKAYREMYLNLGGKDATKVHKLAPEGVMKP